MVLEGARVSENLKCYIVLSMEKLYPHDLLIVKSRLQIKEIHCLLSSPLDVGRWFQCVESDVVLLLSAGGRQSI